MESRAIGRGIGWGVAATVAMSVLMLLGVATGLSPMPKPIPAAIAGKLTGGGLPKPALMTLAVVLHLGYGAFWGGVFAGGVRKITIGRGLLLGVGLWLIMELLVLPWLGWGVFGSGVTPKIAAATLILHLVYGGALGWGLARAARPAPAGAS